MSAAPPTVWATTLAADTADAPTRAAVSPAAGTTEGEISVEWWDGFWGWLITTFLAAVGAVGVVVQLAHRRADRPVVSLDAQISATRPPIVPGGKGNRLAVITNFGRDDALGVGIMGIGLTVHSLWEGPPWPAIRPREELRFTVTVDDDADEQAWFLVTWTTARTKPGYQHAAWLPALPKGPLAEARVVQLRRGPLQRAVARATLVSLPTPGSVPTGQARTSPQRSLRTRPLLATPRWTWLRRALWSATRTQVPDVPFAMPQDPRTTED